uniref:Major facilitator superfamily (MFS) profile domain-containing protein n=1 Tax=Alexandrium monilatum TaxID=311494 RepID=A0A7S4PZZ2_9DINO
MCECSMAGSRRRRLLFAALATLTANGSFAECQGQCDEDDSPVTMLLQTSLHTTFFHSEAGANSAGMSAGNAGKQESTSSAAEASPSRRGVSGPQVSPERAAQRFAPKALQAEWSPVSAYRLQRMQVPAAVPEFVHHLLSPVTDRAMHEEAQLKLWDQHSWFGTLSKCLSIGGYVSVLLACVYLGYRGAPPLPGGASAVRHSMGKRSLVSLVLTYVVWESICTDQYLTNIIQMEADLGATEKTITFSVLEVAMAKGISGLFASMISDYIGRRRTILFLFALMPVSVAACGWAPDIRWFQAACLLQGIAEGGMAVAAGIFQDFFPCAEERASASAQLMGGVIFGPMIAPAIGGLLGRWLGWRTIFIILIPGMLASWVRLYWYLPETRQNDRRQREMYGLTWQRLTSRYYMMYMAAMVSAGTVIQFMRADMPYFLQIKGPAAVPRLETVLLVGTLAVVSVLSYVITGPDGAGVISIFCMFTAGPLFVAMHSILFVAFGFFLSRMGWLLVGSQLSYNSVTIMFYIAGEVAFLRPLEEAKAMAGALKTAIPMAVGSLLAAFLHAFVVKEEGYPTTYCILAMTASFATMAIAWIGIASDSPSDHLDFDGQFEAKEDAPETQAKPLGRVPPLGEKGPPAGDLLENLK